jgi:hypothetical protein
MFTWSRVLIANGEFNSGFSILRKKMSVGFEKTL